MKKVMFKKIKDLQGKPKQYPTDGKVVFFKCLDEDKYFIYALYTNRDLTNSELIPVSEHTFIQELSTFEENKAIIISCPNEDFIRIITSYAAIKSTADKLTVEDLLDEDLNPYISTI